MKERRVRVAWLGGKAIFVGWVQVAEVSEDQTFGYVIRTVRPNRAVGVAFSTFDKSGIRVWLDGRYKGWVVKQTALDRRGRWER